jgi:hypothetical protein
MSTIFDYYTQAELSLAAYSTLYAGISGNAYRTALESDGKSMSPKQPDLSAWKPQNHTQTSIAYPALVESVATDRFILAPLLAKKQVP